MSDPSIPALLTKKMMKLADDEHSHPNYDVRVLCDQGLALSLSERPERDPSVLICVCWKGNSRADTENSIIAKAISKTEKQSWDLANYNHL